MDAEQHLKSWADEIKKVHWNQPADIRNQYRNASILKNRRVVFNIKGKDVYKRQVEGAGVYYVTAGEEIGYGQGGVLKIISVSEQGVKVQAPMMNQPIVVR